MDVPAIKFDDILNGSEDPVSVGVHDLVEPEVKLAYAGYGVSLFGSSPSVLFIAIASDICRAAVFPDLLFIEGVDGFLYDHLFDIHLPDGFCHVPDR